MTSKVDPRAADKARKLGAGDMSSCYHCGTCTATCPLSEEGTSFPRRMIRYMQLGLKDKLMESPEPWLCYYCGDCSLSCPQGAEPGESIMAARRYLTSLYDATGLAYKFYSSKIWELGAVIGLGLLVVLAFVFFHGPIVTDRVELNTFAPAHVIELFDWGMGALLGIFLLSNVVRMVRRVLGKDGRKIPLKLFLKELPALPMHFATQKRWKDCNDTGMWKKHLLLVGGYVTMFVMIFGFLKWFQTDEVHPFWHPQRMLGYLATAALLYGTAAMLAGRIRKRLQMHRFSHSTDWLFLTLLLLTTISGILVHAFRVGGLPMSTYVTYVIHMAILVPMLLIEVPFGKWSHLAYRPVIAYLHQVKHKAAARQK